MLHAEFARFAARGLVDRDRAAEGDALLAACLPRVTGGVAQTVLADLAVCAHAARQLELARERYARALDTPFPRLTIHLAAAALLADQLGDDRLASERLADAGDRANDSEDHMVVDVVRASLDGAPVPPEVVAASAGSSD
jgi:hypothetical protein